MIERMKKVYIVSAQAHKTEMLDKIRDFGVVHLTEKKNADVETTARLNELNRTVMLLQEFVTKESKKAEQPKILSDAAFEKMHAKVLEDFAVRENASNLRTNAVMDAEKIKSWGSFVPAEVEELRNLGCDIHFYTMGKKDLEKLLADPEIKAICMKPVDGMSTAAVIGKLGEGYPANEFQLPEIGYDELIQKAAEYEATVSECNKRLKEASTHLNSYKEQILKAKNNMEYSSAKATAGDEDGLVWLTGYIPEEEEENFRKLANKNGWAWAMDDPSDDDEEVPTKVKYNKITRLMEPVFDILGTVPGYREYDISFWFLAFFTLFFAMIIGDAAYGCIFLIAAILLHVKFKKANNAIMLLYVLSIGTIVWGALTGTWFGLEAAMKVPFLKALVIPAFANYPEYFEGVTTQIQQNNIMKFCFIIGTVQLVLACVMNIRRKISEKNLSFVADIGWTCSICALYFIVLFLVIGENVNLGMSAIVIGIGFVLVVMFGGMAPGLSFSEGLKAGLGNAFTTFLNTISAFGNIMSYIRLFAVGMASLAIAQSFNDMALGMSGPLVVAGALIMIIGHTLNIVMGFLSVVVHGVRLNLLEFSGQLGMEWSGKAYEPFKKIKK